MTRPEPRIQTTSLLILSAVALGFALYWLRDVMIPFVVAVFAAFGLAPTIEFQTERLRIPRIFAIATTLVGAGLMLAGLAGVITISVNELVANSGAYQRRLEELVNELSTTFHLDEIGLGLGDGPFSTGNIGRALLGTANAVLNVISQGILVMIFLVFLLAGGSSTAPRGAVWTEVESQIRRYLVTKVAISAGTGACVGAVLLAFDIDLAMAFGFFAFLLNFIPNIGSVIATLLPIPVVLVNPSVSWTVGVLAIAIPGGIQFVMGNVIEPRILGRSLELHPAVILLSLMIWGTLWGIVGMFLATPLTAILRILLERSEVTAPVAHLMAGRIDHLRSR